MVAAEEWRAVSHLTRLCVSGSGSCLSRAPSSPAGAVFFQRAGSNGSLHGTRGVISLKCLNAALLKQGNTQVAGLESEGISLTTPHLSSLLSSHSSPLFPPPYMPVVGISKYPFVAFIGCLQVPNDN